MDGVVDAENSDQNADPEFSLAQLCGGGGVFDDKERESRKPYSRPRSWLVPSPLAFQAGALWRAQAEGATI
jgi:hypothetical protein